MLSAVVLVSLLVSTSALPDNSMSPGIRLRGTVRPVAQQLHLTLDPTQVATRGTTTIDVDLTQPQRTIWLNARGLKATQAVVTQGTRRWPARFSMADDVSSLNESVAVAFVPRYTHYRGRNRLEMHLRGIRPSILPPPDR